MERDQQGYATTNGYTFVSYWASRLPQDLLEATEIFINVGGRAVVPDAIARVPHLTNASMMDIDFLPEHLAETCQRKFC